MAAPAFSTYIRGGKAVLRDTTTGQLTTHDPGKAADRVMSGRYSPVSAEDVAEADHAKQVAAHSGGADQAAALVKSAATGAFDVATMAAKLPLQGVGLAADAVAGDNEFSKTVQQLGGRETLSNLSYLAGEVFGDSGEKTQHGFDYDSRLQAEANPKTNWLGSMAGQVAGAAATGGLSLAAKGAGLAVKAAAGAAEGAMLGGVQAGEDAWFKNEDLTSEALLSGMGWGALIGGGASLALGGASKLFGRAGSRGATPLDSTLTASSKVEAPLAEQTERMLGMETPQGFGGKLKDAIEGAQSIASGAEKETLEKYGALRWDNTARRGRALWRDREKILEGATDDITRQVNDLVEHGRLVSDEVVDTGLKRAHIESKLSGNTGEQLAAARAESSALKSEVESMLPRPKGLPGSANSQFEDFGNQALLRRVHQYVSELDSAIQGSDDAAAAFIGLDKAKRGLQKWTVSLRDSARMGTDALKRDQSFALANKLGELQEGTRNLLMDEGVWGKAAADQRSINAAWEKFFESKRLFDSHFLTRTGSDFERGAINVADPSKVASYVRRLGRREAALVDQHFRAHVNAMEDLSGAIGKAFDLGEKAGAVNAVKKSARGIRNTLMKADETVAVANQIDAVMAAEKGPGLGGLAGVFGGGVAGGPLGALAGGALSLLSRPGQMMKQAAAMEVLAQNLDAKIGRSVSGLITGSSKAAMLPAGTASRVARPLPVLGALEVFRGKHETNVAAYRARVAEVMQANDNYSSTVRDRAQQALGEMPERAPRLAAKVATSATRAAQFLASKIPVPLQGEGFTPGVDTPVPSEADMAKFARYYNTVANPMSAMRDLERGQLTSEQAETLQVVWPSLFNRVRAHVIEQLGTAEAKGSPIPYSTKVQLDLLLGLNGAGEKTASPEFMSRFAQMRAQVAQQQAASAPQKTVNIQAATSSSTMDSVRKDLPS